MQYRSGRGARKSRGPRGLLDAPPMPLTPEQVISLSQKMTPHTFAKYRATYFENLPPAPPPPSLFPHAPDMHGFRDAVEQATGMRIRSRFATAQRQSYEAGRRLRAEMGERLSNTDEEAEDEIQVMQRVPPPPASTSRSRLIGIQERAAHLRQNMIQKLASGTGAGSRPVPDSFAQLGVVTSAASFADSGELPAPIGARAFRHPAPLGFTRKAAPSAPPRRLRGGLRRITRDEEPNVSARSPVTRRRGLRVVNSGREGDGIGVSEARREGSPPSEGPVPLRGHIPAGSRGPGEPSARSAKGANEGEDAGVGLVAPVGALQAADERDNDEEGEDRSDAASVASAALSMRGKLKAAVRRKKRKALAKRNKRRQERELQMLEARERKPDEARERKLDGARERKLGESMQRDRPRKKEPEDAAVPSRRVHFMLNQEEEAAAAAVEPTAAERMLDLRQRQEEARQQRELFAKQQQIEARRQLQEIARRQKETAAERKEREREVAARILRGKQDVAPAPEPPQPTIPDYAGPQVVKKPSAPAPWRLRAAGQQPPKETAPQEMLRRPPASATRVARMAPSGMAKAVAPTATPQVRADSSQPASVSRIPSLRYASSHSAPRYASSHSAPRYASSHSAPRYASAQPSHRPGSSPAPPPLPPSRAGIPKPPTAAHAASAAAPAPRRSGTPSRPHIQANAKLTRGAAPAAAPSAAILSGVFGDKPLAAGAKSFTNRPRRNCRCGAGSRWK
jgi:hypothetical protein